MYCPFCGTDNALDQKYCRNCGASLPTTVAKPPTKTHSPVQNTSNPRPSSASSPFVPPAPPSLPKKSKPLDITPPVSNLLDDDDPGATNLAYKLTNLSENNTSKENTSDLVDNFYETQAMGNVLSPPSPSANKPPSAPMLRTVEMTSIPSTGEEDLKNTNIAMPAVKAFSESISKNPGTKSEEYFPTVLTNPKPPESPEEQLRLLKELMEAGGESWKVPPPAPPPPASVADQTLSMGAPKAVDKKGLPTPKDISRPFDKTLSSAPSVSSEKQNKKSEQPMDPTNAILDPIPQTLTMKAAPKNSVPLQEDFSYPNLEKSDSSGEFPPLDTVQMQRPSEPKDIGTALNNWSTDVTNPWGSPAPSIPTNPPDAKTAALVNTPAPPQTQQEKAKSKKDAFKTISVAPRKSTQKDTPIPSANNNLGSNTDPLKTAISSAYADLASSYSEKPLAATAPISLPTSQIPESAPEAPNVGMKSSQLSPSVTQPSIQSPPTQPSIPIYETSPIAKPKKASLKILALIAIIILLVLSIIFITRKLVQNMSSSSTKPVITTPSIKPTPVASPVATPEVAKTPEAVSNLPENMVIIPAGEYKVGSDESGPDGDTFSSPEHTVKLNAFYMDVYEVTNEAYSKFIQATNHPAPKDWQNGQYPGKPDNPVSNVSWEDAQAYAKWANKRLPTEQEWEVAASGKDHFLYPWGNSVNNGRANSIEFNAKSVLTVGLVRPSKSSFGLYDMSGNVWEWTASMPKLYPNSKSKEPADPEKKRVFRGGSFQDKIEYCTTTFRGYESVDKTYPILGFRCAKDAPSK